LSILHAAEITGHELLSSHAFPLPLHVPPVGRHTELSKQGWWSLVHWPGCTWQSLSTLHVWPSTLQTWEDVQAPAFLHVEPLTLQVPGHVAAD